MSNLSGLFTFSYSKEDRVTRHTEAESEMRERAASLSQLSEVRPHMRKAIQVPMEGPNDVK
ncbi:hypothetical protein ACEPPN_004255 [Leptodophora sp. 'Broadleaf-Isolate-01']